MTSQRIHIWLCLNMLCMNGAFILGHDSTTTPWLCTAFAVVILYFALSSVLWMAVEGYVTLLLCCNISRLLSQVILMSDTKHLFSTLFSPQDHYRYALYEAVVRVYNSRITNDFLRFTAFINPLFAIAIVAMSLLPNETFYERTKL